MHEQTHLCIHTIIKCYDMHGSISNRNVDEMHAYYIQ